MRKELEEEYRQWLDSVRDFRLPRWNEMPDIDLYMDQVLTYVDKVLAVFADGENHIITSSMINNYVKQGVLRPPENKKYDKHRLAALFIICLFKRILNIGQIDEIIRTRKGSRGGNRQSVYDRFCEDLERALKAFIPPTAEEMREYVDKIDGINPYYVTILAFVNHTYAQKLIEFERKQKLLEEKEAREAEKRKGEK